ncbi:response regulator transcription factor [Sphingomonas sp. MMS12-HWE2-04]|uniref:response regulator transcription factor n=1 Tax=Sphingomonas sp. MMS12-HWE2-04 TaxID=3234199 RepID=UPI00384DC957
MRPSPIIGIVDDDPDVRRSLDSLVRSAGMTARCFASAEDLLDDAGQAALACIVTDLHMPGLTGLDLQAEIARRGWRQPVILMTAYPTNSARGQALAAGAVAFLSKPVDPDALLDAIEQVAG